MVVESQISIDNTFLSLRFEAYSFRLVRDKVIKTHSVAPTRDVHPSVVDQNVLHFYRERRHLATNVLVVRYWIEGRKVATRRRNRS